MSEPAEGRKFPVPTCNPLELRALLAPALGLSAEDLTCLVVVVVQVDEASDTMAVDTVSTDPADSTIVWTLAEAIKNLAMGGPG